MSTLLQNKEFVALLIIIVCGYVLLRDISSALEDLNKNITRLHYYETCEKENING